MSEPCLDCGRGDAGFEPQTRCRVSKIVQTAASSCLLSVSRALERGGVEPAAVLGRDEQIVGAFSGCHGSGEGQDGIDERDVAGTSRLGSLGADPFGLRSADDQPWHRDLDEVTNADLAELRPAQSGPSREPDDVGKSWVEGGDLVAYFFELGPGQGKLSLRRRSLVRRSSVLFAPP